MRSFEMEAEITISGVRIEAENEAEARAKAEEMLRSMMDIFVPEGVNSVSIESIFGEEVD